MRKALSVLCALLLLALPLGSLAFVLFCTTRRGWGWESFLAEADQGAGVKFPRWTRLWLK